MEEFSILGGGHDTVENCCARLSYTLFVCISRIITRWWYCHPRGHNKWVVMIKTSDCICKIGPNPFKPGRNLELHVWKALLDFCRCLSGKSDITRHNLENWVFLSFAYSLLFADSLQRLNGWKLYQDLSLSSQYVHACLYKVWINFIIICLL